MWMAKKPMSLNLLANAWEHSQLAELVSTWFFRFESAQNSVSAYKTLKYRTPCQGDHQSKLLTVTMSGASSG